MTNYIDTNAPPTVPVQLVAERSAALQIERHHHLCAGCGHPIAWRLFWEVIEELGLQQRILATAGHGCYTSWLPMTRIDCMQVLHGRAPSVSTGIKRVQRDSIVMSIQGDGDMVSEGLHEILHAAARGEQITCFLLNNGVFGDTGGQMTGATVIGQRTKTSIDGRNADEHGYPIPVAEIVAGLPGVGYVARGAVNNAGSIARTKRFVGRALQTQVDRGGFSFVEILTMCPTGWFTATPEGPDYLESSIEQVFPVGELKTSG